MGSPHICTCANIGGDELLACCLTHTGSCGRHTGGTLDIIQQHREAQRGDCVGQSQGTQEMNITHTHTELECSGGIIGFFPPSLSQVLYMSNNSVKDWVEFQKLAELQKLENLLFVGMYKYVEYTETGYCSLEPSII